MAEERHEIARYNERITIQKNAVASDRLQNRINAWTDYYSCYTYASTYCCTATRPNMEGETRKQQKEVKTETLTLNATPLVNGFVKAKTGANTSKSVYNNWYKAVYEPPVKTAAKLAALTVGSLALSPAFDAEITEYTATTSNATNSITATGADGAAVAITVNGEAHESGESATWNVGENTVVITVSKDGSESTVYTVTVTKSAG